MALSIAARILQGRLRMGWEQSDLAQRLHTPVSQQTVSRWEKGGSRPRRDLVVELAELLGEHPDDFLQAAGYTTASYQPKTIAKPIRPHLNVLPVWELSSAKFEELVADLGQQLRPDLFVTRFGGQGHTQYGVDVVAEKDSRYVLTYQCKRWEDFGPKDIRDAVSRVTIDADAHFLVLSRRSASPQARMEMQRHPGWTLWDAQDIARAIRGLPLERSVRIVDTYFPGWRHDFLGVPEPGPWLRPSEFFQYATANAFYNHDWTLVGRGAELQKLLTVVSDPGARLGIVIGVGGIGKSKLLWEVARAADAQNVTVRCLKLDAEYKRNDPELLPADKPLLVIIDDAHERDDLKVVLRDIFKTRSDATVLLALRPYATTLLAADLRQIGERMEDLLQVQLSELTQDDAETLAIEAVGPDWPRHLGERLGHLTKDCPFITVVAGTFIRRRLLNPLCVDHEETVRQEILKTFRDVLVADPVSGESELRKSVLDALTVLQPFRSGDPAYQRILGSMIALPYDRAVSHIRALEGAGVLIRRGDSLRVVPDLLADMVLSRVSFDEGSHASTGYLERAWRAAEGEAFQHIFLNAARIDWQIRHDDPHATGLIDTLWDAIEEATHSAGIVGRITVAKLLRKVGYFQPERSLKLSQWLIENPIDVIEDADRSVLRVHPLTYEAVLNEIPAVVQGVAYNMPQQRQAMDLLWTLAATDRRETNRYPEHPIRVLRSLAELHTAKPPAYNNTVVDVATSWLDTNRVTRGGPSPFDVLEPMLATEGCEESSDGYAIRFRPFPINPDTVAPLRERIIALALRELESPELWRATRALKAIEASLHFPIEILGRQVTDAERQQWVPTVVRTLDSLRKKLSTMASDPVIVVGVRHSLQWHLEKDRGTREAVDAVIDALPDSIEIRAATALFDGWGRLSVGRTTDTRLTEAEQEARRKSLAGELVQAYNVDALVDLLELRLEAQCTAFGRTAGAAGPFVWTLVWQTPPLGAAICRRLESRPDSSLLDVLASVIGPLAETRPAEAVSAVERLLATQALELRTAVAFALGWNRGRRRLVAGEFEILRQLVADEDATVRLGAVGAVQRIAENHPGEAESLIAQVDFRDSPRIADEVFAVFAEPGGLNWNALAPEVAAPILTQLVECSSIEGHSVQAFLCARSAERPKDVVRLLQSRIERWEQVGYRGYDPLPLHWNNPLRVRADPDLVNILRELLDWMSDAPDSWLRRDAGGRLIAAIACDFNDPDVLALLQDALDEHSPKLMAALASVLQQLPDDFVWSHPELVARALRAASSTDAVAVGRIAGALYAAAVSGSFASAPGQPFPRDVSQREMAGVLAESAPPGSIEEDFYRSLQRSAEERMRWTAELDAKWRDGTDWE